LHLAGSLRKEVETKTVEVKSNFDLIGKQLEVEESDKKEKEKLFKEQIGFKKELEKKVDEMEKFNSLVIGRELKMVELKKKKKKT
jgi:hypothetical protein